MNEEQNLSRIEQLLEETHELAEENNRLLLSIQRQARWSFWGKLLLWVIVLVVPFLVLGPFLHTILPVSNTQGGTQSLFGLPSQDQIKSLVETYRASMASTTP